MSASLACLAFIQLKPFASPNSISTSQTDQLGMFLGHCSPPDHIWSLSTRVLLCLHWNFPSEHVQSLYRPSCASTNICAQCKFTCTDRANDFFRSPTTLYSLTFRRAPGRPKVSVHLIALHKKIFLSTMQDVSQEKKKSFTDLLNMGRQHKQERFGYPARFLLPVARSSRYSSFFWGDVLPVPLVIKFLTLISKEIQWAKKSSPRRLHRGTRNSNIF